MDTREHVYLEQWLETNKMKFNKALYLEGEKKSLYKFRVGET